jgi:hypothetical protein
MPKDFRTEFDEVFRFENGLLCTEEKDAEAALTFMRSHNLAMQQQMDVSDTKAFVNKAYSICFKEAIKRLNATPTK